MTDRPEIVVLCGSTRFKDEFEKYNHELTLQGKIVLSVGVFVRSEPAYADISDEQKRALDELHKRKIDLADRVLVLNVDGYLGDSTKSEIRYAWSVAHKRVDFIWHMPDEHHDGRMHGLCEHAERRGDCIGIATWMVA